ncbi:MAG: hypothetical protein GY851_09405 [bacterium]|nr:hypothetical protein [bacterium]
MTKYPSLADKRAAYADAVACHGIACADLAKKIDEGAPLTDLLMAWGVASGWEMRAWNICKSKTREHVAKWRDKTPADVDK